VWKYLYEFMCSIQSLSATVAAFSLDMEHGLPDTLNSVTASGEQLAFITSQNHLHWRWELSTQLLNSRYIVQLLGAHGMEPALDLYEWDSMRNVTVLYKST
jgi:hypothetical protein